MDDEIHPIEPKPLETYPAWPEVKAEPVDVPMCPKPIVNDSVNWMDLAKLFVRESVITTILSMKGITMNNDNKATITGVVTAAAALLGIFGLNLSADIISAIVAIGVVVLGYFTNKKDTPAQ